MELNLKAMTTETRNPNTMNLDTMAEAGGHAKTAITMSLADCSAEEVRARLDRAGGHVRKAIL